MISIYFENNGCPLYSPHYRYHADDHVYVDRCRWYGDLDVIQRRDNTVNWYENGLSAFGDPTFGSATITTSADGANGVYAADIDNDGDMDVLIRFKY